ncbi:YaaA family protein [Curtobacterium sp. S6]|uniref:YaaA family protein n=1 Tax=Curtobacterium sp. S6 TaxID=1479623 RepID=UPI0004AB44F9|nr:peroxide stress protein YaaA [Curtobacterium sp. S6]
MLILLPPSESKSAPESGSALDLSRLSFPELSDDRAAMLSRLVEVSSREDAGALLKTGASLAGEVRRNRRLPDNPTAEAMDIYNGVLYDALGYRSLGDEARRRADGSILVFSALWGVISPTDRIPAYRLSIGASMTDVGTLASWWKSRLTPVLDAASEGHVVVDCRSSGYAAAWKAPADRSVSIRVVRERDGKRSVVSHMAKHYRGQVARWLVESSRPIYSVDDVAEVLQPQAEVELESAGRRGAQLTMVLRD